MEFHVVDSGGTLVRMVRRALLVDEVADALQGLIAQFNSEQPGLGLGASFAEETPDDGIWKIGAILQQLAETAAVGRERVVALDATGRAKG